jgi:membrane protein DedA with SNARE-associated domain
MTEMLISHIQWAAGNAQVWGYVMIFVLMAVESSFIPLPSEVIMIPAGFLAYRGELTCANPSLDMTIAIICGATGSIAGAYVNYFLALKLGRPILYRYGKYFFLKEHTLRRAEEIFNEYGSITTFVCRLIPAIRHLISIPAGLSRMNHFKFTFFTGLGAGIWSAILAFIGYYLASLVKDMTYADLVHRGIKILHENYVWLFLALFALIVVYALVHKWVMRSSVKRFDSEKK